MSKRYILKAVNDEAAECAVCGKTELKRVMWLAELDEDGGEVGEAFPCGTTCGAKLLGYRYRVDIMRKAVKDFTSALYWARVEAYQAHPRYEEVVVAKSNAWKATEGLELVERRNHPAWIAAFRLEGEVWGEIEAKVTGIIL